MKTKAERLPAAGKKRAGTKSRGSVVKKAPMRGSIGAGSVDDYIAAIPETSRKTFDALRKAVREAAPEDAQEVRSYGIIALRTTKVLVWYAAFSGHCSLFPTAAVLERFPDELTGYSISKGTVQFPLDKRLPIKLVKKIVRARVADV
jgi:uncharacterized protein YdhG (YjbR/CyaY superfamily)